MFKCNMCDSIFPEPDVVRYDCEVYAGVGSMYQDHHFSEYDVCPACGSEDIDSYCEEDDDGFDEYDD